MLDSAISGSTALEIDPMEARVKELEAEVFQLKVKNGRLQMELDSLKKAVEIQGSTPEAKRTAAERASKNADEQERRAKVARTRADELKKYLDAN